MRYEAAIRRTAAGMVLALLVFVLAAMALAACGGDKEEKATPTPPPTMASPAATATTAATVIAPVTVTLPPSPTVGPTLPPSPKPSPPPSPAFTPTPATPSWQTSAPREPVTAGQTVELGIRNENGAPGETYAIGVQVNLPDGSPVNREGEVAGADWTYFPFKQTDLPGTYTVYFGLPQSDIIFAEDSFEVSEW